jgi:peptidoglycan/LPS O-acetylase OafA/YrhL
MRRVPGLDLLRAIAIVSVMWSHGFLLWYGGARSALVSPDNPVLQFGWMGVDLFFVLSGYLIGSQLLKPVAAGRAPDLKDFWTRRAFRILPAYAVVAVVYFAFPVVREQPRIQPWWQFATFTENLLIDFRHAKAFSHVWSLCVEEHFYLLAPLLILLVRRRPAWVTVGVCLGVLIGDAALRALIWRHDLAPLSPDSADFSRLFMERIYYPTWTRLDGLLAGVVLAAVRTFRPGVWARLTARPNLLAAAGLAALAPAIWLFQHQSAFWPSVAGYPLLSSAFALLVASAASQRGVLGARPIPGAGAVAAAAYSLYLSHKIAYHLVLQALGAQAKANPDLAVLLAVAAAGVGGALLYLGVERPFLRWRDRLQAQAAPAAVAAE